MEEGNMQRRTFAAAIALGLLVSATQLFAQSAKSLVGTYSGVSFTTTDAAGKTMQIFGDNPRAMLVLRRTGAIRSS
jgi:hypothetical protein